jgi:hypothetical protein
MLLLRFGRSGGAYAVQRGLARADDFTNESLNESLHGYTTTGLATDMAANGITAEFKNFSEITKIKDSLSNQICSRSQSYVVLSETVNCQPTSVHKFSILNSSFSHFESCVTGPDAYLIQ